MPKVVDCDARRREVVQAAMRLVAEGGRDAASVRALAAATGRSPGAVRHYVPSSAALEELLLEHVSGRVQERVAEVLRHGASQGADPVETVARQLEQILPLDDERRTEHLIWLQVFVIDTAAVTELRWAWEGQRMFHRQHVLRLARRETIPGLPGALPDSLEQLAGHLHAYVDGLALRVGSGTQAPGTSLRELRAFVDALQRHVLAAESAGTREPGPEHHL